MEERFDYGVEVFEETLKSSFIDSAYSLDDRFAPRILGNDKSSGANVLSVLKAELSTCESFDFSVAFITSSGVQVLVEILNELRRRKIPGRILTSTYLNFSDPSALRKLCEYPNIQIRVFQGNLHAKGFFFDKDGISTIIIGSSNLTQTALTCNKEWNVLFRSYSEGGMLRETKAAFDGLWADPLCVDCTPQWIERYAEYRKVDVPITSSRKRAFVDRRVGGAENDSGERFVVGRDGSDGASAAPLAFPHADGASTAPSKKRSESASETITPNKMQTLALEALGVLHKRCEARALLVSATGTGKTYLSALDVAAVNPGKVLFVAHRKRILEASRKSFERVLGQRYTYGVYGGGAKKPQASCVFAMVGTLSKHIDEFDPREFDYIIFDEAHRSGAHSYQVVLDYFKPSVCLGMTATPSRTDGYDVYGLFNHVIAFRITLQDALDEDMLAPFHYFGIADLEIDDEVVTDTSLFNRLVSEDRVRHIIDKIEEYTIDKEKRRGLIFCNRNEEAAALSEKFNERGYRTVAISGATSDDERDRQIARLEAGEIEYIFSVDILNEGIDIPTINQIIMLRRTESAIVFVQQLGRGLRKAKGKEYTLVLDFIGNYQQNYLVPIALSGDRTYNKDNLRKVVKEGSALIPGCSTISFDKISEAQIFKALEEGKFGEVKLIKSEYAELKQILGRIPTIQDFDDHESIDPNIIIRKFGSYAAFLQRYDEDANLSFSQSKLDYLKFISTKLANGKRAEDLSVLRGLLDRFEGGGTFTFSSGRVAAERVQAASRMLTGYYSTAGQQLVEFDGTSFWLAESFKRALEDPVFFYHVSEAIDFGLRRNSRLYSDTYKDTAFVLNAKYTREEVCKLLEWDKEPNYQNIGGYFHDKKTNTFPVFINYDKDPSISVTTMYEDRFVSDRELIAISKSKRTLNSPEIINLGRARENGMRCFLFVRKNTNDKDDGTEFYFLGEIYPTGHFKQFVMKDSTASAVEIGYRLDEPVRADLYDYLLSDF